MNALVKKEIRLLLPTFVLACLLPLMSLLVSSRDDRVTMIFDILFLVASPLLAVKLALDSFGVELSSGTFSLLLAQPVPRRQIWNLKVGLLALALFGISISWTFGYVSYWFVAGRLRVAQPGLPFTMEELLSSVTVIVLVIFSGGLWTVLLLRQITAAFWFTLLAPALILQIAAYLLDSLNRSDAFDNHALIVIFMIYSAAGFFLARRLFLRAQDVPSSGGTIALPDMRGLAWFRFGSGTRRQWRPRAALRMKELQLHQSQFVIAGILALLHLGVLAARHWGRFRSNSVTFFILENFWMLWLVMPLLVGCTAAADERKMGTLAGQLCLPVRRRGQFAIKAGGVLLLSLLFGAVMPCLLEMPRFLPHGLFTSNAVYFINHGHFGGRWQICLWYAWEAANLLVSVLAFPALTAAIGLVSLYASTLSRNTLQALAPAVLGVIALCFLTFAAVNPGEAHLFWGPHAIRVTGSFEPWRGPLIFVIGIPVLTVVVLLLAGRNYSRLDIGWRDGLQNLLALVVTLGAVAVVTTAIYHRAWEKLTPFELRHGPARLALSDRVKMGDQGDGIYVRLPDGRVWTDDYEWQAGDWDPLAMLLGTGRPGSSLAGHFYAGSNWLAVAAGYQGEQVGIKTDGTLWASDLPPRPKQFPVYQWATEPAGEFVRQGDGTNWSSLLWNGVSVLLVKTDGTLWRWGTDQWDFQAHPWPGLRAFTPQQVGTNTNWAEVFRINGRDCFRKTDGSVWMSELSLTTYRSVSVSGPLLSDGPTSREPGFEVQRATFLEHLKRDEVATMESAAMFGVRDDGTFRLLADQGTREIGHSHKWEVIWQKTELPVGNDTNWLAAAGRNENIVTLKDDGTLWLWSFSGTSQHGWNPYFDENLIVHAQPVRLGTHSDWIAIASANGGIVSLAADGSLWYWLLDSEDEIKNRFRNISFNGQRQFWTEPWLAYSRKPEFLGNVFSTDDQVSSSTAR